MTVALRAAGAAANSAAATTLNVVAPACQPGDLLILSVDVNTATAQTFTGLTGWTLQKNINTNAPVVAVFTKFAVAADSGATFAPAWTTSAACAAVIVAYSGVDSVVTAIDASSTGSTPSGSSFSAGSLAFPLNEKLVIVAGVANTGGVLGGTTQGVAWTNRIGNATNLTLYIFDDDVKATGSAQAISSSTGVAGASQGVALALRPSWTPALRGVTQQAVVANGGTIATPAATQIGDLHVLLVETTGGALTTPTGWTVASPLTTGVGTSAVTVITKFATAAGSENVTLTTGGNAIACIATFAGVSAVDVVGTPQVNASSTNVNAPSVTTTSAEDLLVMLMADNGSFTFTPPAGMTAATTMASVQVAIAYEPSAANGASGSRVATVNSAVATYGLLLALKPLATAPRVRGSVKTQASAATTIAATLPSNQTNGDFAVVTIAWTTNPGAVTDPAGWTVVESDLTGTNGEWFKAYTKITGVAEASPTITWATAATCSTTATCLTSGSLDIDGHTITATSSTLNWPSVTPATAGDLLLYVAHNDSNVAPTMPVGTTVATSDGTTMSAAVAWERAGGSAAAASGARTGTAGGADNTGYIIAIAGASAPNADTLVGPTNGGFLDVSGGVTFQSTYNATDAANANAYALRAKQAGGSYVYWNAGTSLWQGTIVWNALSTAPSATRSVTVPASATIANGFTLNWSMASQESLASLQGPFASDFTIVMQVAPVLSVTAPTGTVATLAPTVQWTTTPGAGTSQTAYRVVVYNPTQYGGGGFSPGVTAGDYDSGVLSGAATSLTIPLGFLTTGLAYRFYVQVTETGGETSSWQFTTATLTLDPPADPTITATPGTDGTTGAPRTAVTVQGRDNLLSAAAASFEDGTTGGWVAGASTTIANSTAQASNGTHSLALTRITSIGTASANTPTGTSGFACQPSQQVTAIVNFRAAATGRTCSFTINWWQASGAASAVRASDTSGNVSDVTTGWTPATLTVTAPSDAAFFSITANAGAGAAAINEVHYVDAIDLGPGSSTVWTRGGLSGLTTAVVQYSDDGGVTWTNLRTSGASIPWPAQTLTVYDYEAPPGAVRRYRAQVQANVGALIASNIVQTTATGTTSSQWVISDPTDPTSGLLFHLTSAPQRNLVEHQAIHTPLGRAKQVRVSDGTKGWAGRLPVRTTSTAQQTALEALLARNVTLLVQSPEGGGRQWYANVSADPTVQQNEHTLGGNALGGVAGRGTTKMPHTDSTLTYVEAERP